MELFSMGMPVVRILGMGMPEMIIILIIILVIFGPKNLPKLGAALGKAVKGVREGVDGISTELGAAKESIEKDGKTTKTGKGADAPVTATAVVEDSPQEVQEEVSATVEAAAGATFCSQCGAAQEEGAKFCKKCGAPIS